MCLRNSSTSITVFVLYATVAVTIFLYADNNNDITSLDRLLDKIQEYYYEAPIYYNILYTFLRWQLVVGRVHSWALLN